MYTLWVYSFQFLSYVFIGLLVSSCSSNVISIESEDTVQFATDETSFQVSEQRKLRVKLRGSRTSGDYNQAVPDGKIILIEDIQIRGPTEVSGSTDLFYASISIGTENLFTILQTRPEKLHAIAYLGVAQTNMDLILIHEGTAYKTNDRTTEMYMQMGLSYEIFPTLHGGGTWAFSLGPDLTGMSEFDLKLTYSLFKHLEIMGGYRWLRFNYYVEDDESVIHVNFRGPFIGVNVPF